MALKLPEQIDIFFLKRNGEVFIDIGDNPDDFAHYKVLCKHYLTDFKLFRTNRVIKVLNHSLANLQKPFMKFRKKYGRLYAGSALWSIPHDFAEYVLKQESKIKREYRYSLAADEVYIHTVCMESEYRHRISNCKSARLIDWENHERNSPKTFTMSDTEVLNCAIDDPNLMFARKFNENVDSDIVKYVSERIK